MKARSGNRARVAVVSPGPVFYQVPLYRHLAADPQIDLDVFYSSSAGIRPYDAGFGDRLIVWEGDLLSGYKSTFLKAAERSPTRGGFLTLRDWDLFRHILHGKYDLVWLSGYSYLTMWIALLAGILARSRVIIRDDQTLLHERRWPKRWIRAAVLRALFSVVGAFYVGQNNREFFLHFGVRKDRLAFVPHAVDVDALLASAPSKADALKRLGLRAGAPVVLFVGKLVPKKAPELLLEAFASVRSRLDCQLLIVGEGPLEAQLREKVQRDAISDVTFSGFLNRSDVAAAYAAGDVLVLPSQVHETWGLVVNEAMHFGLAIVASDKVGSARDLVVHGRNGFVFEARSASALTGALEATLENAGALAQMGDASQRLIEVWSFETAAAAVRTASFRAAGLLKETEEKVTDVPWPA
jgi:glycosyltransferase involved in cell wall biosynthesis